MKFVNNYWMRRGSQITQPKLTCKTNDVPISLSCLDYINYKPSIVVMLPIRAACMAVEIAAVYASLSDSHLLLLLDHQILSQSAAVI